MLHQQDDGVLDLYTGFISIHSRHVKRRQLLPSFEDLKTNFWSRETLVDNTYHLDQIFFLRCIFNSETDYK